MQTRASCDFEVLAFDEAHVICRDHRHAALRRERHGGSNVGLFTRAADSLQLDVITIAKQLEPVIERAFGVLLLAVHERTAHVAFHRARQRDGAGDVLLVEPGPLDHRNAAALAFEIGAAHEASDVAVSQRGLAQQRDSRRLRAIARLMDQQVDADDRLHARAQRRLVELHHREQVVLIGDGDGRHALRRGGRDEIVHAHHAVDQRVLGVQAEMDEGHSHCQESHRNGLTARRGAELMQEFDRVQQLGDRRERAAVLSARLLRFERGEMLRRAVTLVLAEREAGIARIELHHQRVARRLRENRCGADRGMRSIAADDRFSGAAEVEVVHTR